MLNQSVRVLLQTGVVEEETYTAHRAVLDNNGGIKIEIHEAIVARGDVGPSRAGCMAWGSDKAARQQSEPSSRAHGRRFHCLRKSETLKGPRMNCRDTGKHISER